MGSNPNIESIYLLYANAFEKFRFGKLFILSLAVEEIRTMQDNHEFYLLLKEMLHAHNRVISKV